MNGSEVAKPSTDLVSIAASMPGGSIGAMRTSFSMSSPPRLATNRSQACTMLPTPWIAMVLPLSTLARSATGVFSVMPAASATSLRSTSSTNGRSIRLAMANIRWPAAAARRNTGPVPMVKSALPAITALGEPTPTSVRVETLRPSFL